MTLTPRLKTTPAFAGVVVLALVAPFVDLAAQLGRDDLGELLLEVQAVLDGEEGDLQAEVRIPAKPGHDSGCCRTSIPVHAGIRRNPQLNEEGAERKRQ